MSEYDWDDVQDEETEQSFDPRNLPKELRKIIRDSKKAEKEARDEVAVLRVQVRDAAVSSVLAARGVPAKIAKLIPQEIVSADAVEAWLVDYADVFGAASAPAPQAVENADIPSGEDIAAMQRMQATASSGEPFGGRADELMARLSDPSLTKEQLDQLIKGAG